MTILEDLIPHMRRVQAAERDLRDLSLLWQMIEASAAISCPEEAGSILPMLTQTRVRFAGLQQRLVQQLSAESLAELRDELASTAQCTIDILVRNLFERTADVGFLATDDVLRAFCAAPAEERAVQQAALVQRLAEYRAKYSVYDDIIVLATDGRVLARLDGQGGPAQTADAIVASALARRAYVERHAPSDLAASAAPALLYGHRIDSANDAAVGVLVLRFRQADEMQRIFASVANPRRQVALLLLDAEDRVIASNDESHVPLGARVQTAPRGEVSLTTFGGREYLSVTRATHGYQGYQGPGWRAHAMVSLLTAFRSAHDDSSTDAHLTLDNDELSVIQREVDAINADLRRVIWNGRLVAGVHAEGAAAGPGGQVRLKAVLQQIQHAGTRTRDRVALAIGDLYRSSLGRAEHQARELARLAADIMDRNLYERANDCRWWALSPVLQRELAQPASAAGAQALNALLGHINGLYTVYSRLVAFDAQGVVRGLSNDDPESSLLGTEVAPELRQAALALADSQRYAVSAFAPSALSGGVPTYIYLAPVRLGQAVVGGIAIVFNAEREFRAMLSDVLAGRDGLAAFVDAEGRVIASTREQSQVGTALPFDASQVLVELDGSKYASARVVAGGYREFKRSDGYQNHVHAVVALRMGSADRRREALFDRPVQALPAAPRAPRAEFALFQVGPSRFGLPAELVLEARPRAGLVRAPLGLAHAAGLLEVPAVGGPVVIPVLCARSLFGVHYAPRENDGVVLVLAEPGHGGRPLLGLRVDDVLSVVDADASHLQPAPAGLRQHSPLLVGLLRLGLMVEEGGEVLAQVLDGAALCAMVALARPTVAPQPESSAVQDEPRQAQPA